MLAINEDRLRAEAIIKIRQKYQPAAPPFHKYAGIPEKFFAEILHVDLTEEQKTMLRAIMADRAVNVQAAHGVGKTFLMSGFVVYWITVEGGLAITTAPTGRQVKELLWSEIRRHVFALRENGHTLPKPDSLQWRINEDWRGYGFSAANTDSDGFQGIHHAKLLAIQDEANGISNAIDEGFVSCITGAMNKGIRIGNPTSPGTPFFKHCKRSNIKIPVWNHPNVAWAYKKVKTDDDSQRFNHILKPAIQKQICEKDGSVKPVEDWPEKLRAKEKIPGAVTIQWIEDRRRDHGEQSNYWRGRIDAEFPEDSEDALIPKSWFRAAVKRYQENKATYDQVTESMQWHHGLDVGDGGDPHATCSRRGQVLYQCKVYKTLGDRLDVARAADICKAIHEDIGGKFFVDIIGVGSGACSILIRSKIVSKGVNIGTAPHDPKTSRKKPNQKRFRNLRAQMFWNFREMFRLDNIAIAITDPKILDRLEEELSAITYSETITGKIQIAPKDDIKEIIGRSTDMADAAILAFYEQLLRGGSTAAALGSAKRGQAAEPETTTPAKPRKKMR